MHEVIVLFLLAFLVIGSGVFEILARQKGDLLNKKQANVLNRIFIASALLFVLELLGHDFFNKLGTLGRYVRLVLYLVDYYIIGHDIVKKAWRGIRNKQVFDENFLMVIATLGALVLAIAQNGDYLEAIMVMLLYQVGELFQSYAVGRSRKNISELMDIRPDYANILKDDKIIKVDPDEVEIGSIIVVNPGEKVPIDGEVIEGNSSLNTVALTGESLPRDIRAGYMIVSGCINLVGVLKIKTTKDFGESTVSKILDLVENATSLKSKSEDFISKFARYYTPAVCYAALALAILPPLVLMIAGQSADFAIWLYRALTFLVASCPCALVISIPLSFFAGIGGASKEGILVKGSNYLETLSKTRTVVFDKTGTLTKGVFEVVAIHHNKIDEAKLLEYAAYTECASLHPIAKSIKKAYGKEIDHKRVSAIKELSGMGVTAMVDSHMIACGNDKLMESLGIDYIECHSIGTIVHVAIDKRYEGHIVIGDKEKPNAKEAIRALYDNGVKKTIMLTGDIKKVAEKIGQDLGVDEVYSELLPSDKVAKVEKLLKEKDPKDKLVFVGDGINDAPVLSRSDIGIAMGAMGSDAAIEASDIVLMDDDPLKIAKAIKISRKCLKIVYQNIIFAIGIKLICLLLVALGLAGMWLAVFADVGVMVLAVLNAIRCLFVHNL